MKRLVSLIILTLVLTFVGFLVVPHEVFTGVQQGQARKLKANIRKLAKKKWKIDRINARKGDEVSWTAAGGDLYFQFMDSTLFGEYNYSVKQNNTLHLVAKGKKGTYQYAIFNMADSSFVEENSPPKIIIE